ncbi:hypothetical protein DNTS_005528 [Danionella cerebrum]|uniref:Protein TOPAZ1 n=1 Tax=Danionella cerebrum TaxID=2873325 RepID=A0A553NJP1_9TELE|nr:hypothetical protein DNTS_005528 [Danionella translucida]
MGEGVLGMDQDSRLGLCEGPLWAKLTTHSTLEIMGLILKKTLMLIDRSLGDLQLMSAIEVNFRGHSLGGIYSFSDSVDDCDCHRQSTGGRRRRPGKPKNLLVAGVSQFEGRVKAEVRSISGRSANPSSRIDFKKRLRSVDNYRRRSVKNTCCSLCGDIKYAPVPSKNLAYLPSHRHSHGPNSCQKGSCCTALFHQKSSTSLSLTPQVKLCDLAHVFNIASLDFSCVLPKTFRRSSNPKRVQCVQKEFGHLMHPHPCTVRKRRRKISNKPWEVSTLSCASVSSGEGDCAERAGFLGRERNVCLARIPESNGTRHSNAEKTANSPPVDNETAFPESTHAMKQTPESPLHNIVPSLILHQKNEDENANENRFKLRSCFRNDEKNFNPDEEQKSLDGEQSSAETFSCQRTQAYLFIQKSSCARTCKPWPFHRTGAPLELRMKSTGGRWIGDFESEGSSCRNATEQCMISREASDRKQNTVRETTGMNSTITSGVTLKTLADKMRDLGPSVSCDNTTRCILGMTSNASSKALECTELERDHRTRDVTEELKPCKHNGYVDAGSFEQDANHALLCKSYKELQRNESNSNIEQPELFLDFLKSTAITPCPAIESSTSNGCDKQDLKPLLKPRPISSEEGETQKNIPQLPDVKTEERSNTSYKTELSSVENLQQFSGFCSETSSDHGEHALGAVVSAGNPLDVSRAYEEDILVLDVIQDDPELFGVVTDEDPKKCDFWKKRREKNLIECDINPELKERSGVSNIPVINSRPLRAGIDSFSVREEVAKDGTALRTQKHNFCMDTLKKFCVSGKHLLILRAVEVFVGYYSRCSPGASFVPEAVTTLLLSLISFCLLREIQTIMNLLLHHKRLPAPEILLAVFQLVRERGLLNFVPELILLISQVVEAGCVFSEDHCEVMQDHLQALQVSRQQMDIFLALKRRALTTNPHTSEVARLAQAAVSVEMLKQLEDWTRLGQVFSQVCAGSNSSSELLRFCCCVTMALLKEPKDKLSLPYEPFAQSVCGQEACDNTMMSILGRIGGVKLVTVMLRLRIDFTSLQGLMGNEHLVSRCQLLTMATELFLCSGSIEGALRMLKADGWFVSSGQFPCEPADVENRKRVLILLAEKTSQRDTLEILSNLPGVQQPVEGVEVHQYTPLLNAHLRVCLKKQTLLVAADTLEFMFTHNLVPDTSDAQSLIHRLGKQNNWSRARVLFRCAQSSGFYSTLVWDSESLILPCSLSEIEMTLAFEMFISLIHSQSVLIEPATIAAQPPLIITLRRQDVSESVYLAAGCRLLSAALIPNPKLIIKYTHTPSPTHTHSQEQRFTLERSSALRWIQQNHSWAHDLWT